MSSVADKVKVVCAECTYEEHRYYFIQSLVNDFLNSIIKNLDDADFVHFADFLETKAKSMKSILKFVGKGG